MKRLLILTVAAGMLSSGIAFAQTATPNDAARPPAIATGDAASKTAQAPVAGKNSFTRKQAAHRLRKNGYSAVKGLAQDDQGVWRGTATKDGKTVNVSVDYQGNVSEQ